jgi:hypothetical protein
VSKLFEWFKVHLPARARSIRRSVVEGVAAAAAAVGADTAVHAVGLALLGYGAFLVYPPAGFMVPGACLVWWTLPSRPPFVAAPTKRKGDPE